MALADELSNQLLTISRSTDFPSEIQFSLQLEFFHRSPSQSPEIITINRRCFSHISISATSYAHHAHKQSFLVYRSSTRNYSRCNVSSISSFFSIRLHNMVSVSRILIDITRILYLYSTEAATIVPKTRNDWFVFRSFSIAHDKRE